MHILLWSYIYKQLVNISEVYTGALGINHWNKIPLGDGCCFLSSVSWCERRRFLGWSLTVCLPPEAAPSASMINAAAYLPSLGSGVPFLLLYPAAPAAGTERTRRGLFPLQHSPWHHEPTTNHEPTKPTNNKKKNYQSTRWLPPATWNNTDQGQPKTTRAAPNSHFNISLICRLFSQSADWSVGL